MIKRYFVPHLTQVNPEWKDFTEYSKNIEIDYKSPYIPNDYDLIYIKKGYIKLYCKTNKKNEVFTLIVGENSLANVGGTITGANRFSKIVTDTKAELRVYDSYFFWDLDFIKSHARLIQGLSKTIASCMNFHIVRSHYNCFYSSLPQLCQTILTISQDSYDTPPPNRVKLITQKDLADLSGMHPITACNNLKKLREAGVIGKLTQQYIEILDMKRFNLIATSQIIL